MSIWHIVGNGPGKLIIVDNERIIRFNQPASFKPGTDVTITNSKQAGLKRGFLVQGEVPEQFIEKLDTNSRKLEEALGCKSSLGLLAIQTMLEYQVDVRVSCMALLPSLERTQDHSNKKALPAAYHNWLGERRLALPLKDRVDWPELLLQVQRPNKLGSMTSQDCFHLLQQLPSLSRKDATNLWEKLSKVGYHTWLDQANDENIQAIEPLFYVSRDSQFSPNWWMYDNQTSLYVNRLQKILASVQQTYLLSLTEKA